MFRMLTPIRALLLISIAAAVAIAILASIASKKNIAAHQRLSSVSVHGQIGQLENEFVRFLSYLSRFRAGDTLVRPDDIAKQFDRLWSTAALLNVGAQGELVRSYDGEIGAIPLLIDRLQKHRTALIQMDRADDATNEELIVDFGQIEGDLQRLWIEALAQQDAWQRGVRDEVVTIVRTAEIVFHGALVLAALLTFAFLAEGWHERRTRREHHRLVRQARSADNARTRFLSMMSHELRTPMNGVLGLLQLLRQSRLSESQERLVDQAERSGRQMTDLLGDILEFSELQAERLEISSDAYRPQDLADSIEELLAAAAARNRIAVTVECARGAPEWIAGDFTRLRQALTHVAANLVGDDQVRLIRLLLSHDVGRLVVTFDVGTFTRPGPGSFGRGLLPGTNPDALGITIARGLISMMGGEFRVNETGADTHEIEIAVPGQIAYPRRDCVRIEAKSETSAMLMRRIVEDSGLRLWSPSIQNAQVAAILLELPLSDEESAVERLRSAHTDTRLIAVGRPMDETRFDGICHSAVDHRALAAALETPAAESLGEIGVTSS